MSHFFKFRNKTVAITSLYTSGDGVREPGCIYLAGAFYRKENGRREWTGEQFGGNIPEAELLKWAVQKRFVTLSKARYFTEKEDR